MKLIIKRKLMGFTLMEMLIVAFLISVITAFAIPNYHKMFRNSNERKALSELMVIDAACKIYKARNGSYPQLFNVPPATFNPILGTNVENAEYQYTYVSSGPNQYVVIAGEMQFPTRRLMACNPGDLFNCINANPCCVSPGDTCKTLPSCI